MDRKSRLNNYDPRVFGGICHRGLHGEGITENGMRAFQKAVEANMAFELDVHLTLDGKLIVCHDDSLLRTTGKEGIIEELDSKTIRDSYRLLDGESVPLLSEVLALNEERVPIIVELKVHKGNYKPLKTKVMEELASIKNSSSIVLISFDPRALLGIGKRFQRQLLVCKEHEWTWKLRRHYDGVDIDKALLNQKKVQDYRKRGGVINVWTIETPEQFNAVKDGADMVTFQHFDIKKEIER